MEKNIKSMAFSMMPETSDTVRFSDRIVLYDNLDKPLKEVDSRLYMPLIDGLPTMITFALILLCVEGEVEIDCNLRHLSARDGGLVVLVPGTLVKHLSMAPNCRMIVMAVPDQEYAPSSSFQNATYAQKNFTSPISLQLEDNVLKSGIESYLQLKNAILTMGEKVTDDLVKAYILVMAGIAAVNLQKWMIEHPEEKKRSKEKILNDFLSEVEKDHRKYRDVSHYANVAGLSPKYFAKVIWEASGKRPLEWIRECVILDAKAMLKTGEHSIGQICEVLNFRPQSLFNRYFKDATGLTPMQYAKGK